MPMLPFQILTLWARGLLTLAFLILGPYLIYRWYQESHEEQIVARVSVTVGAVPTTLPYGSTPPKPQTQRVFAPHLGFNGPTALLAAGLIATLWALPTGPLNTTRLLRRPGTDDPRHDRSGRVHRLRQPDGSTLQVEEYGRADGPPIVFTHGWGMNATQWDYAKRELGGRFRLITWDLPGLGLSDEPADKDYRLENLARRLDTVIALAGGRPVVLVGHSIGGMILLTYCKLFPEALGPRVCGLVLAHTTYTNPVRTTKHATLYSAIQKPVLEPLLHLTIPLSPVLRALNWLSYWSGSAHSSSERSGFSGRETRGQLDFVASFSPHASPAVLARGMLGMLRYDATGVLPTIRIPVQIVAGDQDPMCKPQASDHLRATIPTSELMMLSPAKHQGLIEHHAAFARAIEALAARCSET